MRGIERIVDKNGEYIVSYKEGEPQIIFTESMNDVAQALGYYDQAEYDKDCIDNPFEVQTRLRNLR